MPFKGISYLELWQSFCSTERNHLCNLQLCRYYDEPICEIILKIGQWFRRRCLLKDLSGALATLLVSGAEPFYSILKECIMGNIHMKLYEIRTSGSVGYVI